MGSDRDFPMLLPGRVLIVEDDRGTRMLLGRTLGDKCDIIEAENGVQGLQALHSGQPDFVITDLTMPEMDGLELIDRARQSPFAACVPILVLTSQGEEDVLLECFRKGADDFMVKPFSARELLVRVSSIYLRQSLAREVNPLTGLPGNSVLKREITARLSSPEPIAIAYIDLDHFKAFNDAQGFDRGDRVVQLVGDLLRGYAMENPPGRVFIGHVGGDDFVAVLPRAEVEQLGESLHAGFASAVRAFYDEKELARGTTRITNRKGEEEEVPLLSMSIAVVHTEREGVDDLRKVAHIAAEVKRMAKSIPGNSLFIDRRKS